ncbi:MAG: hypothetical protein ABIK82_13520 [Pseudomonadota bacterium]
MKSPSLLSPAIGRYCLRGENFFHPDPPLLQGYRELAVSLKS